MNDLAFSAIAYGLLSALFWGSGDFLGGFLSKKFPSLLVLFFVELFGLLMLVVAAVATAEPISSMRDLMIGAVAGIAGMIGILNFYQGLATFRMGVIAPMTAVLTAIVPVIFGFIFDGLPGNVQLAGLVLALLAIWLISGEGDTIRDAIKGGKNLFRYALLAGLFFCLFFMIIAQVSEGALYWPIVSARVSSLILIAGYLLFYRSKYSESLGRLSFGVLFLLFLGGLLDSGGNAFFILAAQSGRLDVSSVLASLYPGATVFLAWLVLREKISMRQAVGVVAAVASVALIAV